MSNQHRRNPHRKSKKRGDATEEELELTHQVYWRRRDAFVRKTQPAATKTRDGMFYTGKGMPDYVGVLSGGRAVMFEVKRRSNGYFNFKEIIKDHQESQLLHAAEMGAAAFWLLHDGSDWGILTPRVLRSLRAQGEKSVGLSDIRRVTAGKSVTCDWLPVAREL